MLCIKPDSPLGANSFVHPRNRCLTGTPEAVKDGSSSSYNKNALTRLSIYAAANATTACHREWLQQKRVERAKVYSLAFLSNSFRVLYNLPWHVAAFLTASMTQQVARPIGLPQH